MNKFIEWLERDWILLTGFPLAILGGFYSAYAGERGFMLAAGSVALALVFVLGSKCPGLAPYIVVAAAVFDREIRITETFRITTLTVLLLVLAPGFIKVALQSKVLPRFAAVAPWVLALGFVIASIVAPQPDLAWQGLIRWVPVLIMVVGVASMCATQKNMARNLGWSILGGGAMSGVFGILQRAGHYAIVGPPYVPEVIDSTFGYYTNFANFEALAAVIGLGLILAGIKANRRLPVLASAATTLCLYMVVSSFSRGAIILVAVGLLVILAREIARPGRFIAVCGGIAALGWVVLQVTPAKYVQEIVGKFSLAQGGDVVRSQLQAGGLDLLAHKPLGIGFNNFSSLVSSGEVYSTLALAHSHSTFVQMGLDAGWLGLAAFVVLVGGAALVGFRTQGGTMAIAFSAALIGFLAQVSQDYFFFEEASLAMFGLLIAGSLGAPRQELPVNDSALSVADYAIGDPGRKVRL
jgi:hypothetical protein